MIAGRSADRFTGVSSTESLSDGDRDSVQRNLAAGMKCFRRNQAGSNVGRWVVQHDQSRPDANPLRTTSAIEEPAVTSGHPKIKNRN